MKPEYMDKVLSKYGFKTWDAVYAAIGHGGLKEGQVINKLVEEYKKANHKMVTDTQILNQISEAGKNTVHHHHKSKSGIIVKGIDDVAVRFSKCCNPLPGDEIVGFITRGRGISIHRTDCVNIMNISESDRARLIDAEWQRETASKELYKAEINIYVHDGVGVLVEVLRYLRNGKLMLPVCPAVPVKITRQRLMYVLIFPVRKLCQRLLTSCVHWNVFMILNGHGDKRRLLWNLKFNQCPLVCWVPIAIWG